MAGKLRGIFDEAVRTVCRAMISAGEATSDNVVISISEDKHGESSETVTLSVEIASAGDADLKPCNTLALTIAEDRLSTDLSLKKRGRLTEGQTAAMVAALDRRLEKETQL